jgi:hypothetical protein
MPAELATATLQTRLPALAALSLALGSRFDPGPTLIPVNRRHARTPVLIRHGGSLVTCLAAGLELVALAL